MIQVGESTAPSAVPVRARRAKTQLRARKPADKAAVKRSYFARNKWPRIVRELREYAADPMGVPAGVIISILGPLLYAPARPIAPLPMRRTVSSGELEVGEKLLYAYRVEQWELERAHAAHGGSLPPPRPRSPSLF